VAELQNPRLVDSLDKDAADYGTRDGRVAKPPYHERLDFWRRRIEDSVADVIAGQDCPDLSAIGDTTTRYTK